MVPHDKDKDNPSELIRGKDVAAFGLWSLPSFDEPRDEPAVAAPQVPAVAEPAPAPPAVEEVGWRPSSRRRWRRSRRSARTPTTKASPPASATVSTPAS